MGTGGVSTVSTLRVVISFRTPPPLTDPVTFASSRAMRSQSARRSAGSSWQRRRAFCSRVRGSSWFCSCPRRASARAPSASFRQVSRPSRENFVRQAARSS